MTVVHTVLLVSHDVAWTLELAVAWARAGDGVTVVLCDQAAAGARAGHPGAAELAAAGAAGVVMRVHDEALAARGIGDDALHDAVKPVDLDEVADLLVDVADRAVWL